MIKLTKDSVYKWFLNYGQIPCQCIAIHNFDEQDNKFVFMDKNAHFTLHDENGVCSNISCHNLVSEYTPVRPTNEMYSDFMDTLTRKAKGGK